MGFYVDRDRPPEDEGRSVTVFEVPSGDCEEGKPRKKRKRSEEYKKKQKQFSRARRKARRHAERTKLLEELAAMGLKWFPIFRKFPDEFQRSIFETAYYQETKNAAKLALVSRKVKDWIEPLIYRDILLSDNQKRAELLSRTLNSGVKPLSFFTRYVQSIHISGALSEHAHEIDIQLLSICTNIRNFECWSESREKLSSLIQKTRFPELKTLCINLDLFPHGESPFFCPIFQHITHLDIGFTCTGQLPPWTNLNGLQNLTHVRVKIPASADRSTTARNEVVEVAWAMKPHLPSKLQYLVLLMHANWLRLSFTIDDPADLGTFEDIRLGTFDSRILLGCYEDEVGRKLTLRPSDQGKVDECELVAMLPVVTMPRQLLHERFAWKEVEEIARKRRALC